VFFGLAVSCACLWHAFTGVAPSAVAREIGHVGQRWVMASAACVLLSLVFRTVR